MVSSMNFAEKVRKLVTDDGSKMNLTEEQRQILLKVQNAGNAELYEGMATSVSAVEIAKAVEMASVAQQQTNSDVFASKIDLNTGSGHELIPCATSKATNIVTGDLKDATVIKAIVNLEFRQVEGSTANAAIRNDTLMPFTPKETGVTDDIVKKATVRDFSMSGTLFPEGIQLAEELNAFMNFQHQYKAAMMAEFLSAVSKMQPTEDQLLTIYRGASRSLAEDYFDTVWMEHYPLYDNSDGSQVRNYLDAKKAFMGSLDTIGSKYMSSSSIRFGMQLRKVSISPDPKWTSEKKVGHVKKFGATKSYYVGTNIDSGLQTVPVTTTMAGNKMKDIIVLTKAGCSLIEKETRLENGISGNDIVIPDYNSIRFNTDLLGMQYYEILNIDKSRQDAIYEKLTEGFRDKAEVVVGAVDNKNNQENADMLASLLGR